MKKVEIYTDGACSGNPGKGGWGAVLIYKGVRKELSAGYENITVLEDTLYPRTPDFYAQDYLHPNDMGNLLHEEEILKAARLIL